MCVWGGRGEGCSVATSLVEQNISLDSGYRTMDLINIGNTCIFLNFDFIYYIID